MKTLILLTGTAAAIALAAAMPAQAHNRYAERPPVQVSPDMSAPWVMQLQRSPQGERPRGAARRNNPVALGLAPEPRRVRTPAPEPDYRMPQRDSVRTAAVRTPEPKAVQRAIDPVYLPQVVDYDGGHPAGTIVIDTRKNFLFLVEGEGKARRYGVGTGKPGFEWAGTHKVTQKREWPDWRPPAEMIAREKKKGRNLPVHMAGGPDNPLGARALYLGSTLYRIHGTNQPWTIGNAVSSGCIRMRNEDVVDLYDRVKVGTKVIVM